MSVAKDIFDRIEPDLKVVAPGHVKREDPKDIFDSIDFVPEDPLLKKFTPPKVTRFELTHEIETFLRREIARNLPKKEVKAPEPFVEALDKNQIGRIVDKSVAKVLEQVAAIWAKNKLDVEQMALMKLESEKLKLEIQKLKEEPEFRVIHHSLPDQAGHNGQSLFTDGRQYRWGPPYENGTNPVYYLGPQTKDGSWRIIVLSPDGSLSLQKRESGIWNEKGGYQ